jgi:hypothetical protein
MGIILGLLPWNWSCFKRYQPKSTTGKVVWNIWWGLSALPGPGPAWWLLLWAGYELGYEKEVMWIIDGTIFIAEKVWWAVSTTAKLAWFAIESSM